MKQQIFLKREVLLLIYSFKKKTLAETAKLCNCSQTTIWKNLHREGIPVRSQNTGKYNGIETRFKKGQKAWNKGTKGIHLSSQSEFKSGHRPHNSESVGTISIRHHRRDDGSTYPIRVIKIAEPKKWMEYTRYLWIQEYGKVLDGDKVVHLDKNSFNDSMENLLAIPSGEYIRFTMYGGSISAQNIRKYLARY